MTSALGYVEETLLNAEIVKLVPKCLAPYVGGALGRCLNSHKTFFTSLIPATEQRIRENELRQLGHIFPKRVSARSPNNIHFRNANARYNQTSRLCQPKLTYMCPQ